jgi:hypothetical protein
MKESELMYEDQAKYANQVAIEVPPWERAHQTLNELSSEMQSRLKELEGTMQRLEGERAAISNVLSRIAPAPPLQPASAYPPRY